MDKEFDELVLTHKELWGKLVSARDRLLVNLKEQMDNKDTEDAHEKADGAFLEFFREIEENEIVEAYEKVDKWYA